MPPKSQRTLSRSLDDYAWARCVNCRHLRYDRENPGDPCRVCGCTEHVLPGEQAKAASDD